MMSDKQKIGATVKILKSKKTDGEKIKALEDLFHINQPGG